MPTALPVIRLAKGEGELPPRTKPPDLTWETAPMFNGAAILPCGGADTGSDHEACTNPMMMPAKKETVWKSFMGLLGKYSRRRISKMCITSFGYKKWLNRKARLEFSSR